MTLNLFKDFYPTGYSDRISIIFKLFTILHKTLNKTAQKRTLT